MDTQGKEGSYMPIFIVMLISIGIAFYWNKISWIKDTVHSILDPSAGVLLNWHITYGFLILIFIITLIMTLAQKYLTDQETMKEMKAEQKKLGQDLKQLDPTSPEYKEMSMKSLEFIGPMMKLSMRPMIYTGVPIILFFRWFMDTFTELGSPKFWIFSWFWFYLIMSIVFSSILRKILKVA
jgi:uncharacterized membrane protein (DUF106 family)